jgi:5-aminopentanamidase
MRIALASPPLPSSISDALYWSDKLIAEAARQHAGIVCFPESFIPGYPVLSEDQPESADDLRDALDEVRKQAAAQAIAVILPMNWYHEGRFYNVAQVISAEGELLGYQTKNQLDPSEDNRWIPGTERTLFEINGLKFGIVICHEGFRYPESVRWAARRGAKIVFHPQCTGSDVSGPNLVEWGHKDNPYYEKAMSMRALENTIYFASVNYTFRFPESATALIGPHGACIAHERYRNAGVVIADIDPEAATGLLAGRFKSDLYY